MACLPLIGYLKFMVSLTKIYSLPHSFVVCHLATQNGCAWADSGYRSRCKILIIYVMLNEPSNASGLIPSWCKYHEEDT